jgi:hypothetical protein
MQRNTPKSQARYDEGNRLMCSAKSKRSGELCRAPAIRGSNVCRMHGGAAPQTARKAKLRLLELVDPAIATLAREMTQADASGDRQKAANSILDRAGWGRVQKVETTDARDLLLQRLLQMRDEAIAADEYETLPLEELNSE